MTFISSFEINKVVVPEPCIFFCIPASIAELAAVKPNNPSGFMTDFYNGSPFFNNGPRSLPKNPPE